MYLRYDGEASEGREEYHGVRNGVVLHVKKGDLVSVDDGTGQQLVDDFGPDEWVAAKKEDFDAQEAKKKKTSKKLTPAAAAAPAPAAGASDKGT